MPFQHAQEHENPISIREVTVQSVTITGRRAVQGKGALLFSHHGSSQQECSKRSRTVSFEIIAKISKKPYILCTLKKRHYIRANNSFDELDGV